MKFLQSQMCSKCREVINASMDVPFLSNSNSSCIKSMSQLFNSPNMTLKFNTQSKHELIVVLPNAIIHLNAYYQKKYTTTHQLCSIYMELPKVVMFVMEIGLCIQVKPSPCLRILLKWILTYHPSIPSIDRCSFDTMVLFWSISFIIRHTYLFRYCISLNFLTVSPSSTCSA